MVSMCRVRGGVCEMVKICGVSECACDGGVVKCRAVPQQAVWVVIFAVYDAGWKLLLYVFDDVDVDVVAGGSKVLLDLVVEEVGKGGVVCRRWWKVVTLVPGLYGPNLLCMQLVGFGEKGALPGELQALLIG